jgi:hypothetical protein
MIAQEKSILKYIIKIAHSKMYELNHYENKTFHIIFLIHFQ